MCDETICRCNSHPLLPCDPDMSNWRNSLNEKQQVSVEVVYQELYEEMRRYRDYQFSIAAWYTAMQLGVVGFLVSSLCDQDSMISFYLDSDFVKAAICSGALLLTVSSVCIVQYCHAQYRWMRQLADRYLEPEHKRRLVSCVRRQLGPAPGFYPQPHMLITFCQVGLFIVTVLVVMNFPSSSRVKEISSGFSLREGMSVVIGVL